MKMLASLLLVPAGLTGAQGTGAAERPMTFADLMAIKRVGDPQISPSGRWLMFPVMEVSQAANGVVNHLLE